MSGNEEVGEPTVAENPKPLFWIGSSLEDLREQPLEVRREIGFALHQAQLGGMPVHAKPLKGFAGAGVLEIVSNYNTDTFRGVYSVKLAGAIYVLHVFQKKSKRGAKTPKPDLDTIARRLKLAKEHHENWIETQGQPATGGSDSE